MAEEGAREAREVAVLERGVLARVRTTRVGELVAWAGVPLVVARVAGLAPIGIGLLIVALVGVAVRVAIATEHVRCDELGVHWRSLFWRRRVPWTEVALVEVAVRRVPFEAMSGGLCSYAPCLRVVRRGGAEATWLTPSVWTSLRRHNDFVGAARRVCPFEWYDPDDEDGPRPARTAHRPSGRRVGRPGGRHRSR